MPAPAPAPSPQPKRHAGKKAKNTEPLVFDDSKREPDLIDDLIPSKPDDARWLKYQEENDNIYKDNKSRSLGERGILRA